MEIIDVTGMEPGEILWQRQFVMVPDHFTQVCALVTTAKGPSGNKVCILARAPGGRAGCVARSLHTAAGMLVARALPAGPGASSKMYTLFPDGP